VTVLSTNEIVAAMVAVSFAAGLNVYATIGTLGLLARLNVFTLPPPIALLSNEWVIGASLTLFVLEFFADKIPVFDLFWNALQTFVRVPAGALLAWSTTTSLSPTGQLIAALAGAAIALAAHGGKLALRGAVTASPEPVSNTVLSLAEDVVAIGLTWFATEYPFVAAGIALVLLAVTVLVIRWVWRALRKTSEAIFRAT
jgi:Domain of unknown function (DUF4126)